jgi:cysteine desulfurase
MLPYFDRRFGNPASRSHRFGWEAEKAVEKARKQVAELAGAVSGEIVFTSGAPESNNLALKGVWEAYGSPGRHLVTMRTEHRAVLDPLRHLERLGARITLLPPRADGLIDLDLLREAILPETALVSVMYANNEIGVVQPVQEIGAICREKGVLFHSDAAQAFGKLPVAVAAQKIDLLSLTAHKIYGPKGVGALYVRRGLRLAAQMDGGGHESGLRSGTLNAPGIVGLGEACAICELEMRNEANCTGALRDRLLAELQTRLDGVSVNGSMEYRLPGNLNLSFRGIQADALLTSLPEIALSTGSACSSATPEPSHVLRALGLSEEAARGSVRVGLGRFNTEQEVDYAAGRLVEVVEKLRLSAPS